MRRVATGLAALALALAILGIALVPLETAWFTAVLSGRYSEAEYAGLAPREELAAAENVRAFVVDERGALPEDPTQRRGFDAAAIAHLEDVAGVLVGARRATLFAAVAFVLLTAVLWRLWGVSAVTDAARGGGCGVLALVALAGLAAAVGPSAFFSAFHGLFFSEGTWTFSYDSLLIRLFPWRFWVAAGVSWGLCLAVLGGGAIAVAAVVRDKHRRWCKTTRRSGRGSPNASGGKIAEDPS